ncbi:MAG: methylenetetrahydrofolate reductase, partial [Thermoplasmata archaeon]|nr:methylenetetrahydrofolate reductase [Thermoplasmata archaeon]
MKVSEILENADRTLVSLEVFPPKVAHTPGGPTIQQHLSNIFDTVERLSRFEPAFVSVTYNPEGKTRATSIPVAAIIKQRFGIESVAHLTCIATPREDLRRTLDVLDYFDIDNILALKGDRPVDHVHDPSCMTYASELVTEVRRHGHDFCIGVAGYPEGHPECTGEDGRRDL